MLHLYAGVNGQGKTVKLYDIMVKLAKSGKNINQNLENQTISKLDNTRIGIISDFDSMEKYFAPAQFMAINNQLVVWDTEQRGFTYTRQFMSLASLICNQGQILILDEPDLGLGDFEINQLVSLLYALKNTYEEIYISTHNQDLFHLGDKFYWVTDFDYKEISEVELYAHAGQI